MQRIDTFLVEHNLVESREQAKRLILAGAVTVNGTARIKPGQRIPFDAKVVVQRQQKYVSRGGFKLEKALGTFEIDVHNRVGLDVGASTGGFTDCLLQHGAKFVYAVDVGYGQLAWKLRTHPQVQPIEKTNIRHLSPTLLKTSTLTAREDFVSIAVIDVSFISLRTVLPSVLKLLTQQDRDQFPSVVNNQPKDLTSPQNLLVEGARQRPMIPNGCHYDIIALLKPQFEAGKAHVKKGGIVSDKRVHIQTIDNLTAFITEKLGVRMRGLTYSPIHKDIGNVEYLLWLTVDMETQRDTGQTAGRTNSEKAHPTTAEIVEAAFLTMYA